MSWLASIVFVREYDHLRGWKGRQGIRTERWLSCALSNLQILRSKQAGKNRSQVVLKDVGTDGVSLEETYAPGQSNRLYRDEHDGSPQIVVECSHHQVHEWGRIQLIGLEIRKIIKTVTRK